MEFKFDMLWAEKMTKLSPIESRKDVHVSGRAVQRFPCRLTLMRTALVSRFGNSCTSKKTESLGRELLGRKAECFPSDPMDGDVPISPGYHSIQT